MDINKKQEIENTTKTLRDRYYNSSILQIVRDHHNIDVLLYDFETSAISGALIWQGYDGFNKNTILLNKNETGERNLFTLAHEFGHYILRHKNGDGKNFRIDYYNPSIHKQETEKEKKEEIAANHFAGALLMPKNLMEQYTRRGLSIPEIADMFGVSPSAVLTRLEWLK